MIDKLLAAVWGRSQGWVSVPIRHDDQWVERWLEWPGDRKEIVTWITNANKQADVYFSPLVYAEPTRRSAKECRTRWAWADFDAVTPKKLDPKPTILWETSPGRYQGLYALTKQVEGDKVEQVNRRIAVATIADPSGWDAGQVLRIPGTRNHKYEGHPKGRVVFANGPKYGPTDFDHIEIPKAAQVAQLDELPYQETLKEWADFIPTHVLDLLETPKDEVMRGERSDKLWQIIRGCVDAGLSNNVIYTLAKGSAWNKFAGRSDEEERLRAEIAKAVAKEAPSAEGPPPEYEPEAPQIESDEWALPYNPQSWLSRYIEASQNYCPNAPYAYHLACGLALLSMACGRYLTSNDIEQDLAPTLYQLVVGPSRSGKSRTLKFATRVYYASGLSALVPHVSAFSPEGLVRNIADAPQHQIWLVPDEAGDLFGSMHKRGGYMKEARGELNKLYDGVPIRRVLSKETIEVLDPALTLYALIQPELFVSTLQAEDVAAGFIPRFLVIYRPTAYPEAEHRPLPPGAGDAVKKLGQELFSIRLLLQQEPPPFALQWGGQEYVTRPKRVEADFSLAAFRRFQEMTREFNQRAKEHPEAAPILAEAGPHALKIAMLLAIANNRELFMGGVEVTEKDVRQAIEFVTQEIDRAESPIASIGGDRFEHAMQKIVEYLKTQPGKRATRTEIQQRFGRMIGTKRDMDQIEETLRDRGLIEIETQERRGKPRRVYRLRMLRRRKA